MVNIFETCKKSKNKIILERPIGGETNKTMQDEFPPGGL